MEICSVCLKEFTTEQEYLDHVCSTGFKPIEFAHQVALDPNYEAISKGALARGSQVIPEPEIKKEELVVEEPVRSEP